MPLFTILPDPHTLWAKGIFMSVQEKAAFCKFIIGRLHKEVPGIVSVDLNARLGLFHGLSLSYRGLPAVQAPFSGIIAKAYFSESQYQIIGWEGFCPCLHKGKYFLPEQIEFREVIIDPNPWPVSRSHETHFREQGTFRLNSENVPLGAFGFRLSEFYESRPLIRRVVPRNLLLRRRTLRF